MNVTLFIVRAWCRVFVFVVIRTCLPSFDSEGAQKSVTRFFFQRSIKQAGSECQTAANDTEHNSLFKLIVRETLTHNIMIQYQRMIQLSLMKNLHTKHDVTHEPKARAVCEGPGGFPLKPSTCIALLFVWVLFV